MPKSVPLEPEPPGGVAPGLGADEFSAYAGQLGQRARRQVRMLSALVELQRDFLVEGAGHTVFERMVEHLVELSGSEYGFIGEVLSDADGAPFLRLHGLSDIAWDARTRALFERVRDGGFEFHNLDTLFGAVVRGGEPIIANQPTHDTRSGGLPPGHPPLRCFLGLPLKQRAQLLGVVGLANAPGGYDALLVEDLAPMMATCTSMIVALRLQNERNAVQRALRDSETHFRNLANSGSALIWTSGTDALCNYFNEPWLRFTGRTMAQELRNGWTEGVHPDDYDFCLATYADAFERRESFRMEYRLRHADGRYRWLSDEGHPRYDHEGRFIGYIGHCLDITDRKRAELALDALASRYSMLSGTDFYQAVCRHMAEALDVEMAFIGERTGDGDHIQVRAGWADAAALAPFVYALADTPCAGVIDRAPCVIAFDVSAQFPKDRMLVEAGFVGYGGVPIFDKEGRASGVMVVLSRRPLADAAAVRELFDIFDGPVSAELVRERAEAALNRRIAFEHLVSRISSELMPAGPLQVDGVLDRALGQIGRFAGADRAFVFEVSADGACVDNTYEWCREGVSAERDNLQGVPFDDAMQFCRLIKQHRLVDYPDVGALGAAAEVDKAVLRAQGIQSTLAAPMIVNDRLLGFIGLDSVTRARIWLDEEKTLMTLAGNAFASVLERKAADEILRESEARYRSVVESIKEVIFQVDAAGHWIFLNRAWAELTGFGVEQTLGRHHAEYVHPDDRLQHAEVLDILRRREQAACTQAFRYLRIGGGFRWVELNARPVLGAGDTVLGFSGTLNDITLQKEHEAQLEYVAHYDALTGLPNRVLFQDRLNRSMVQARRRNQKLAVAYIDLDGFKAVNDTHGHQAGDQLLTTVAARMKSALREGDSVSRLGGDEFVAVLVDLPDTEACKLLVQRLLHAVAQGVTVSGAELNVSASIGLTLYPQAEEIEADTLLRQADLAMYQAKLAGKNRYHFFDTDQDRSLRGRHEGVSRIRKAIRESEFRLLYQPKVNMRTGALVGVEALIRWHHPELGVLEPAAFLPTVEDHPLALDLGEWVLGEALMQAARWKQAGLALPVSVNIAARDLQAPDFMLRLQAALARHPELAPGSLELEVLETSALESITHVSRVVEACAAIGVSFALDDFGTGYSSLAYLKRLPAARLKIDQVFVRGMLEDAEDLAILKAILGLASAFRREVIAEGVETIEHGELLLQLGCDTGQGYGIARPMPAGQIPEWAASWSPPPSWVLMPR